MFKKKEKEKPIIRCVFTGQPVTNALIGECGHFLDKNTFFEKLVYNSFNTGHIGNFGMSGNQIQWRSLWETSSF
jgi:hypothetical protein